MDNRADSVTLNSLFKADHAVMGVATALLLDKPLDQVGNVSWIIHDQLPYWNQCPLLKFIFKSLINYFQFASDHLYFKNDSSFVHGLMRRSNKDLRETDDS